MWGLRRQSSRFALPLLLWVALLGSTSGDATTDSYFQNSVGSTTHSSLTGFGDDAPGNVGSTLLPTSVPDGDEVIHTNNEPQLETILNTGVSVLDDDDELISERESNVILESNTESGFLSEINSGSTKKSINIVSDDTIPTLVDNEGLSEQDNSTYEKYFGSEVVDSPEQPDVALQHIHDNTSSTGNDKEYAEGSGEMEVTTFPQFFNDELPLGDEPSSDDSELYGTFWEDTELGEKFREIIDKHQTSWLLEPKEPEPISQSDSVEHFIDQSDSPIDTQPAISPQLKDISIENKGTFEVAGSNSAITSKEITEESLFSPSVNHEALFGSANSTPRKNVIDLDKTIESGMDSTENVTGNSVPPQEQRESRLNQNTLEDESASVIESTSVLGEDSKENKPDTNDASNNDEAQWIDATGIPQNDASARPGSELQRLGYRFGQPPDPREIAEAEDLLAAAEEGVLGDAAAADDLPTSVAPASSSTTDVGVSLAFVFDATGSMHDDLMAVMAGTQAILKTMMEDENKPIHNYVLVPFKDPKVGPLTVTTNHTLFNSSIKAISVHGGQDCPEMALGGIKMALEASLPRSFIYVFTDASAKDVDLLKEVLALIQRKKSQVVFVLTGDCNDRTNVRYLVYEKIADVSSGQVFHLNKTDVEEVLKFVRLSLQSRRVNLLSVTKPGPSREEHSLLVDGSLDDFTVAVAGTNPEIGVEDPKGRVVHKPQLQPVLTLSNVKVVKVEKPDPGRWTVKTSSTSQHSVRSTGTSRMDFRFGFSVAPVANMHQTFHRPLKGTPNHILVKATENEGLYNLTYLRFVNLNGTTVHEIDLMPIDPDDLEGAYTGIPFLPPHDMFFIEVTGLGTDGFPLKRMTPTAISAQKPDLPIVTMKPRLAIPVGQTGTITCYVESLVPFTVIWLKDDELVRERTSYKQTSDVFLQLTNMTEALEGSYTCYATNEEGSTSKQTKLRITGPPPVVTTNEKIVAVPGENVELVCNVVSFLKYTVSWFRYAGDKHDFKKAGKPWPLQLDSHINFTNPNTLAISKVKPEDEGWYACMAQNRGGKREGNIYLQVRDPVQVVLYPTKLAFQQGDDISISCRASGTPEPSIYWSKNGITIEGESEDGHIQVTQDSSQIHLFIEDADISDEGHYECYAENNFDNDKGESIVEYQEMPSVQATQSKLQAPLGDSITLQCDKTGIPTPMLQWYKDDEEILPTSNLVTQGDILKILGVKENDAGAYTCEATNILGSTKDTIRLEVGNPPQIIQKPRDTAVEISQNVSLPCMATGYPSPVVSWGRKHQQELPIMRHTISSTGTLYIFNAHIEDAGIYICSTENKFGNIEAEARIKITGVEKPVIDRNDNIGRETEKPLGSTVEIPCRVLIANPVPKHTWYKDGTEIDEQVMFEDGIIKNENGSLIIPYITHKHEGTYECVVSNVGGSVSKETILRVIDAPHFVDKVSPEKHALVGEDVQLKCEVQGEPKPLIMWEKDGFLLSSTRRISKEEDDSLIIRAAGPGDKGIYTCIATNSAGTARRSTFLFMQSPPKISAGPQELHAIEGQLLTLKCEVSAEPIAHFTWWKNEKPLNSSLQDVQYLQQNSSIRFVATVYAQGKYTCVATNPAGKDSRDFEVSVMVPPNIYPPYEEQIAATLGEKVVLDCEVFGSPPPSVYWHKDGEYLKEDSDEVEIGEDGTLTILNITSESGGIYICDAENDVGVSQKLFYFSVNVPPKVLEVAPTKVQLMEGEDFFLPCTASGYPFPEIRWHKDGRDLISLGADDMIVQSDGTLMLLSVNQEHSGLYVCVAENKHGSDHKNYLVDILIPPSMIQADPTELEVKEGESLVIACPAMDAVPPPQIEWMKDGRRLDPFSKRLSLLDNGRALKILEAHPADTGTYWCVATNLAGQSSASFDVDVLTAPSFSDNSIGDYPRHHIVMVGKSITFRCTVSGHPTPRVTWKKNNHPVTLHTAPGVVLSGDKQILQIPSVQQHDAGVYQCSVMNKVGSFYRDFKLTVTKPPSIIGPKEKYLKIISGSDILLQCPFTGLPEPTITWSKNGLDSPIMEMNNAVISSDKNLLEISLIKPSDSGIYSCEASNIAGKEQQTFNLSVLEPPTIVQAGILEDVSVPEGGSVSLECWIHGAPYPQIMWMHNGNMLEQDKVLEQNQSVKNKEVLILKNLQSSQAGQYTCLASNEAGIQEKSFHVHIMVAPKMMQKYESNGNDVDGENPYEYHEKIKGMSFDLHCPVEGKPLPKVEWIKDSQLLEPNIVGSGPTLQIQNSNHTHTGNYTCVAFNAIGTATKTFQVLILESPSISASNQDLQIKAGDKMILQCEVSGMPPPEIIWFKGATSITTGLWPEATFLHNNSTLVIPNIKVQNSGQYSCLAINKIGTAEHNFNVQVLQAPYLPESVTNTTHTVKLNRRLILRCLFEGSPFPNISWYKEGKPLNNDIVEGSIHISSDKRQLHILNAKSQDTGNYKCIAENVAGIKELLFSVDVQTMAHWTAWGPWSECSVSCGTGEQIRQRTCGEPDLEDPFGQIECPGSAEEWQSCNMAECQVNGGWSEWSSWTSCSISCGRGTRRRYRKCDNPVPMYGGAVCLGSDAQQEYCHQLPCPIDGHWSEWTPWTECSVTCDNGVQHRSRQCNNPPPMYGGANCTGKSLEVVNCNSHECPQDGHWSNWSKWTSCTTSCGSGNKQRSRECNNPPPKYGGNVCKGENLQISHCTIRSCDNIPLAAALRVRGKLNGEDLTDSLIAANITDEGHKRTVQASINDILKNQAGWFPYLTFMLSPISWNTALEQDDANNGYSLTQGRFKQESMVEFGSGEGLQLRHIGHGIDDTGVLRVDIEVHGQVPIIEENAQVIITPFEEDYVQTSSNSLFASAASSLKVNGVKLPYSWNNTVSYDSGGTMPYLVEKLSAQEVGVKYNPKSQEMTSVMSTAIGRKFNRDTCPDGFVLDNQHMHCRDINECSDKRINRCHVTQICENLFGTYRCSCERGFRSSAIGKRCVDINECLQTPSVCSHRCRNTRGSFKCQCPPGFTLLDDGRTCSETQYWDYPEENEEVNYVRPIPRSSRGRKWRPTKVLPWTAAEELYACPPGYEVLNGICHDINECKLVNICSENETCLNTKSSFRCLETPCPKDYERNTETGYCQIFCDTSPCEDGALLTQTVSYMVVTPEDEAVHPYQDLLHLSVRGDSGQQLAHTRYRITENETGKPFRVRFENGQGILYSLKSLPAGRIYRVAVLALSYDEAETNILYTKKFIIFINIPDD